MTDYPTTGALVSDPDHVQLHDSGWLRLPSGVEVAILWDSELQLFARLGWAAADAWAREHRLRLPSVAELQERRYAGLMTAPWALPDDDMCEAAGIVRWHRVDGELQETPQFRAWRDGAMRSHLWCKLHDLEVLRQLEAGASVVNTKHHFSSPRGIYGWFRGDRPIQSPYTKHSETWTSYALTTVVVRDADDVDPGGTTDPAPDPGALPEPDQWRPLLRRGMTGRDVQAWKVQLNADGYETLFLDLEFDEPTDTATREWQAERELQADGVVGPITRAAIGSPPVPDDPPPDSPLLWTPEDVSFRQAKHYQLGRDMSDFPPEVEWVEAFGRMLPRWIVLHTAEMAEVDYGAEALQTYAATMADGRVASWHYSVDNDSICQSVRVHDTAFAAGPSNEAGIQIELSGRTFQGAEGWADPYSQAQLRLLAKLLAYLCDSCSIPAEQRGPEDLLSYLPGITDHYAVTKATNMAIERGIKIGPWYSKRRNRWRKGTHVDGLRSAWPQAIQLVNLELQARYQVAGRRT